jgi:hypothetical protein
MQLSLRDKVKFELIIDENVGEIMNGDRQRLS